MKKWTSAVRIIASSRSGIMLEWFLDRINRIDRIKRLEDFEILKF